jgi:hypothetical protein
MPLSWNEIRTRALAFSREWVEETSEDAEAKSFWDDFFNVFGISRRRVANFERAVKKIDGRDGYIDLLWKGMLLVEHKSRGKDLDRAHAQAREYFHGLTDAELPRFLLVSDFARFRLYDLETGDSSEFPLEELHRHIRLFGFMAGYRARSFQPEDPANVIAAERMGKLHDALKAAGYDGHPLEVLLVRLLFCLFADDTGIFEAHVFQDLILQRTATDGSDLGLWLGQLFQTLNTDGPRRQRTLDEQLAEFPYVNGRLFAEGLPLAAFDASMRTLLLEAAALDWSRISPAIFGSMFQSVMKAVERRNLGAHYTSETNILKAVGPLFLDELVEELNRIGVQSAKLRVFHQKLAGLRFLDPACGCGNFLVIAYRELRLLELEVLRRLHPEGASSRALWVTEEVRVDVDQFFGIEIEEFPAQIAQVALWLVDHQMNMQVSEAFGNYFARLPLRKSPTIVHDNALRIAWADVVEPQQLNYILGNPPFLGKQHQNAQQKADMEAVVGALPSAGLLDYVAAWYVVAARYIQGTNIRCAFVSTNSIAQGEQVGVLWAELHRLNVRAFFAHRTFTWSNEARGNAAVHCVIVGFACGEVRPKRLFDYAQPRAEPHELAVSNINPYLVDAPDVLLESRRRPIVDVVPMAFGSMPNDGGHLLLSDEERQVLLDAEPASARWIRPFLGADEFINGVPRWCLWLVGIPPEELRRLPLVSERVAAVRALRAKSTRAATNELASFPTLFGENRQPAQPYILVPRHSSENRQFIPIGFVAPEVICGDSNMLVADASLAHFGEMQSSMHMAWVRNVCGRIKSDYRYSAGIVYNNFPWLEPTAGKHRDSIERAAREVLDARGEFEGSTLAALYDPVAMPPRLVRAHQALDRAVDSAFVASERAAGRRAPRLGTDAERAGFLFERHQALTSLLPPPARPRRPASSARSLDSRSDCCFVPNLVATCSHCLGSHSPARQHRCTGTNGSCCEKSNSAAS